MKLFSATFIMLTSTIQNVAYGASSRTDRWRSETIGQQNVINDNLNHQTEAELDTYKHNLLQYVLQTNEPRKVTSDVKMPYIMNKLYNLLADNTTGREKRSAPFKVDLIRGLEDHYGIY